MIWSSLYAGRCSTPGGSYKRMLDRTMAYRQRYGNWVVRRYKKPETTETDIVPGKRYSKTQLVEIADQLLRDDARSEVCRECKDELEEIVPGVETGEVCEKLQHEAGEPITDDSGNALYLRFPEYACENGHKWFQGEGKAKGIDGDDPILFEEHFRSRHRREIYTKAESAMGKPDPEIESGLFWRTHPQGRKQNDERSRKAHGAGFYKG